ncbi:MAG: hypothetical protein MUC59_06335 [Saprospiraceae bacterium]|nr:hypothetical protein [Saprospiraceae bacterium]
MAEQPVIYVLAGPNGIGKTTVNPFFIPKGVPYINADDIARQLKERLGDISVQELANAQALELMNEFIAINADFAIETNLADQETWLFLKGLKASGYSIHLDFFCVSDVETCVNRVFNRVFQGGHFVQPEIVRLRYEAALRLLKLFKEVPNYLILSDNAADSIICAELKSGKLVFKLENAPEWVEVVLADKVDVLKKIENISDVREKYNLMKKRKTE